MVGILEEIKTLPVRAVPESHLVASRTRSQPVPLGPRLRPVPQKCESPADAVAILVNEPNEEDVVRAFQYLRDAGGNISDCALAGSHSRSIVRAIITHTIPTFWHVSRQIEELLQDYLTSSIGISALVAELASQSGRSRNVHEGENSDEETLAPQLDLLDRIIRQDNLLPRIRSTIEADGDKSRQRLAWTEACALLASGKVISTVSGHLDKRASTNHAVKLPDASPLDSGASYASQLSKWIVKLISSANDGTVSSSAAQFLSKAFMLGYTDVIVKDLLLDSVMGSGSDILEQALPSMIRQLRGLDQRRFLYSMITFLDKSISTRDAKQIVSSISAILTIFVAGNEIMGRHLYNWLVDPSGTASASSVMLRSCLAVFNQAQSEDIQGVMEIITQTFGEVMFIKHAPMAHQEGCAKVILVAAAIINHDDRTALRSFSRSGAHMTATSARLNATTERARLLGMCVASAISSIADELGKGVNFDSESLRTPWAKELMSLIKVDDTVGSSKDAVEFLRQCTSPPKKSDFRSTIKATSSSKVSNTARSGSPQQSMQGPRVVEVVSDDDDDLQPYAKPDSDPEDEDDDPTVINRDKAKAPVYIRDLLAGLRETEKYEVQKLAIEHAAPLLRRKAKYGQEIHDYAEELGQVLIGLQDTFELEDFITMRLQALIALLLSDPKQLGPWYAKQAFIGDYSLSQRAAILSAMGLAARELAGYSDSDTLNPSLPGTSFPSKQLPSKYHAMYKDSQSTTPAALSIPLNSLSRRLTDTIMAPLAATAIDTAAGPTALKVRPISSRITRPGTKHIPNALATLLHDSFFTPLLGHFQTYTWSTSSSTSKIFTQPFFLTLFIKTLAILLHAAGPSTTALAQLTAEFWTLLLALRRHAIDAAGSVLEALLFALLTLLEINQDDTRRVASEHARELVETREWVGMIFGRLEGGGGKEADRLRGLAAGVLVRCAEVVEKWERLMVGELINY